MRIVLLLGLLLFGLLVLTASARAQSPSERTLLHELENLEDRAELRATVDSIRQRLDDGTASPGFRDGIVRVMTTSAARRRSGYVDLLLGLVGAKEPHSERSLLYMAEALSAEPPFGSYRALESELRARADGLPDRVFDVLVEGLEGPHPNLNLNVLADVPPTDPRFERVIDGVTRFLTDEADHRGTRSMARTIGVMYRDRSMPPRLVAALAGTAMNHQRLDTRVEALVAIAPQQIESELASTLAETLHRYLTSPDAADEAGLMFSPYSLAEPRRRLAEALLELLDPPYPDYLVTMWLGNLGQGQHERALEVVQGMIDRQGLSDEQFAMFVRNLDARADSRATLSDLLALEFESLPYDELDRARRQYEDRYAGAGRRIAGYRLVYHYGENGVPVDVADTALETLRDTDQYPMIPVSLALVSNARDDVARYEAALIELVGRHANQHRKFRMYLATLGPEFTVRLALRYGPNDKVPGRFRYAVIDRIDTRTLGGDAAEQEVVSLLLDIARNERDNLLVQTAGKKLDELGVKVPFRVALRNTDNIRTALGVSFLLMLAINSVTFFAGLAAIMIRSDRRSGGRTVGALVLWILLSLGVLFALGIGFLGFIGHNSAPPVGWTLGANMPALFATVFYVVIAVIGVRGAFRRPSNGLQAET